MIVTRQQQLFGVGLLVFVNIVWVAASEITRYLFIDLGFKRPFFFTYAKSCMLSLFLLHYACSWGRPTSSNSALTKTRSSTAMSKKAGKAFYSRLNDNEEERPGDQADEKLEMNEHEEEEDEDFDVTLTEAEFEPVAITDVESNTGGDLSATESQGSLMDNNHNHNSSSRHPDGENSSSSSNGKRKQQRRKRVRFSRFREVRSWPQKLEQLANLARKPYTAAGGAGRSATDLLLCGTGGCCSSMFANSTLVSYSLGFAPLWLLSSVSYQTALAHSSVSSVNLISASAPLFVLMLSALLGRRSSTVDSFNWFKLVLVLMNLGGVCIVSRFSDSVLGSLISLFSAFTNALYLFALSRLSMREQEVNMPLMLGIVGIFSLLVCTPLMVVLQGTGIEPQLPLPSVRQLLVLVANSFLGTLFADSLWLYATLLTGSLVSALSTSLGIPLSMLADSVFRNQPPNLWQLISSIPIMISFIGASMLTSSNSTKVGSLNPNGNNGGNNNNNAVRPIPSTSAAASSTSSRSSIGGGQSGSDDQSLLLIDGGDNNDDE